ncbi:hypothetical protein VPH35_074731 [Triticum aestivum]|uniref:FT-interacting protein 7-like n=1 Tax=Triticum aestivum TaxID=4565 RepID=UPI0008439C62|nr:FT-interacting protein 7-like [Triticum aestivum]
MTSYTVVVDVASANGLSGSPPESCVELRFAGQKHTTSVKNGDCRTVAVWNKTFRFSPVESYKVDYSTLEAYVYSVIANRKSFVGRVRLSGSSLIKYHCGHGTPEDYPLRGGIFPRSNGTLRLKVSLQTESPIRTIDPLSRLVPSISEVKKESTEHVDAVVKKFKPIFDHGMIVESMPYIFVHVVKAQNLPYENIRGRLDRYVQVKVGNYGGTTEYVDMEQKTEWNATFAFSELDMDCNQLVVIVKNVDGTRDDSVGMVSFDICNIPASSYEPKWHPLVDETSQGRTEVELMLAVWKGSQADEKFHEAWKSDSCMGPTEYHLPHLWYLRVHIFEFQCETVANEDNTVEMNVTTVLGGQLHQTTIVKKPLGNHSWDQEFMFVAAEPFEEHLQISVQAHLGPPDMQRVIGEAFIPLQTVQKRVDGRDVRTQWLQLKMPVGAQAVSCGKDAELTVSSCRIHLATCLEGGYTVQYDSTDNADEVRPAASQIVDRPTVGLLHIGILGATGLYPRKRMDGELKLHPYCVAKYGKKWVRTRTVKNSCNPVFNEQYSWEVYDTSTVLTIGVFDNAQLEGYSLEKRMEGAIGKVRIRLSYLQPGKAKVGTYPILRLHPTGVKLLGELRLSVIFSADSVAKVLRMYSSPILPEMHYKEKLSEIVQDNLRLHAVRILSARFSQMDPPLWKEVVEDMCDIRSTSWSMRKSNANFYRIVSVLSYYHAFYEWLGGICLWNNPTTTLLAHAMLLMLVSYPEFILPGVFLCVLSVTAWNYRCRHSHPAVTWLSLTNEAHPDELDEEFDTFPTSQNPRVVMMRYDRLRHVAARIQTVLGDFASHLERIQALASWRDTPATAIFGIFTLSAALVLYFIPWKILVLLTGLYTMRHPKLRRQTWMPSILANIYWRLPQKTHMLL